MSIVQCSVRHVGKHCITSFSQPAALLCRGFFSCHSQQNRCTNRPVLYDLRGLGNSEHQTHFAFRSFFIHLFWHFTGLLKYWLLWKGKMFRSWHQLSEKCWACFLVLVIVLQTFRQSEDYNFSALFSISNQAWMTKYGWSGGKKNKNLKLFRMVGEIYLIYCK